MTAASTSITATTPQINMLEVFTKLKVEANNKEFTTAAGVSAMASKVAVMLRNESFSPFHFMLEVISDRLKAMEAVNEELDRKGINNRISLIILKIKNLTSYDVCSVPQIFSTPEKTQNVLDAGIIEMENLLTGGIIGFSNPHLYQYINALCSLVAKNKPKTVEKGLKVCYRAGIDLTPILFDVCARHDLTPLQIETLIKFLMEFDANPNGTFLVQSPPLTFLLMHNSARISRFAVQFLVSAGLTVHMPQVVSFASQANTVTARGVATWLADASVFRASVMEKLLDAVFVDQLAFVTHAGLSINGLRASVSLLKGLAVLREMPDLLNDDVLCIIASYFAMPVRLADKICLEAAIKDYESKKATIALDSKMSDD